MQLVKQRLEPPALFFQGSAAGQVQVDGEKTDHIENMLQSPSSATDGCQP
jgi:hypothetical protein